MARRGNSVIGIDLGKHVFKGVLLQRKGDDRFVLTSYASREVPEELNTPEELAQQLKLLFKDLGGSAKGCAIAISDPGSLLRIIEQPNTPIDLLRNALRLNGLAVLNQECKDFVLDCAPVPRRPERQSEQRRRPMVDREMRRPKRRGQDQISRGRNVAADCKTNFRGAAAKRVSRRTSSSSRRSAPLTLLNSPTQKFSRTKPFSCSTWDTCKARS